MAIGTNWKEIWDPVWKAVWVTVEGDDDVPIQFTFTDQFSAVRATEITSAAITVTGINTSSDITVSGGTYSINEAAFTSNAGTVEVGDSVRARHTSSASYSTSTNTTVTIGGVSDIFTSVTIADPALSAGHNHTASAGGMGRMMGRS